MLTIFANIRINNEEGLQHLKDSFYSFNTVSNDWLINVRGTLRAQAIDFLSKELGDKMVSFQLLDDSRGWINNALEMIPYAKHEYLLIWNEDHLNISSQNNLVQIIEEMKEHKADYLLYSWWLSGKARKEFDGLPIKKGNYVDSVYLTKERWEEVLANGYPYYLLSLCGVYHKDFFKDLLTKDRVKFPMFFTKNLYRGMTFLNHLGLHFSQRKYFHLINKIFFHKFRRFPKETPFDLEKPPDRKDVLPFTMALVKQELFACIDDDLDTVGYQLIKRGEYPIDLPVSVAIDRNEKNNVVLESNAHSEIVKVFIPKNKKYQCRYYEETMRTVAPLKETIVVTEGEISIESRGKKWLATAGDVVFTYPNLGYVITAGEDSSLIFISANHNAKKICYIGQQGLI